MLLAPGLFSYRQSAVDLLANVDFFLVVASTALKGAGVEKVENDLSRTRLFYGRWGA